MKRLDIRYDDKTMELLKSLVGKRLEKIEHLAVPLPTCAYGVVVYKIAGEEYSLTNKLETMDYMNEIQDVGVFKFKRANENEVDEIIDGHELIETPVEQEIEEIRIMNEKQQLFEKEVQTYDVDTVRGMVFVLKDGREVSAEKDIWFSECIKITVGHDLMKEYSTMEDFFGNWEDYPEYMAKGSREIIELK